MALFLSQLYRLYKFFLLCSIYYCTRMLVNWSSEWNFLYIIRLLFITHYIFTLTKAHIHGSWFSLSFYLFGTFSFCLFRFLHVIQWVKHWLWKLFYFARKCYKEIGLYNSWLCSTTLFFRFLQIFLLKQIRVLTSTSSRYISHTTIL